MADLETDVAVIGAGTAGLTAEHNARKAGARTLLIDEAFIGTTCANNGCMPSKLLIAAADAAHQARKAGTFGIRLPAPEIDGPAVMKRVQELRDGFAASTRKQFDRLPDGTAIKARARFTGQTTLALDDGRTVSARAIVIATGSAPVIPGPFKAAGDAILTNESIFELEDLPASVGVIGAGPLGLELAQALARLGVQVEVFDMGETVAGLSPGAPESSLREALSSEFELHLGVKPAAERTDDGVRLSWADGKESATFERLLLAAGRAPNFDGLDLAASGLDLDERGTPVFDAGTMQCGKAPVFIAGDANAALPILHEASGEGTIAGTNAASYPDVRSFKRKVRLQIMFTEPNMAVVGSIDAPDAVIGSVDYARQGRARVMAQNAGVCELYADPATEKLAGAVLVGPDAEHLAHLLAWSIQGGATAGELLDKPFYHPTLEEGLKTALKELCQKLKAARPPDRDDGFVPGEE